MEQCTDWQDNTIQAVLIYKGKLCDCVFASFDVEALPKWSQILFFNCRNTLWTIEAKKEMVELLPIQLKVVEVGH